MPRSPHDADLARFAPRVTVMVLVGISLFFLASALYALPVFLEPVPPDSIPDYLGERVAARLEGKVPWLLVGSFLTAAALAGRGWLPGTRK